MPRHSMLFDSIHDGLKRGQTQWVTSQNLFIRPHEPHLFRQDATVRQGLVVYTSHSLYSAT
jgi:hypothetical protein